MQNFSGSLGSQQRSGLHIAEIIATATTECLAQCPVPADLDFPAMPPFGSWVKAPQDEAGSKMVYGVVYHGMTGSIDSAHRPTALGMSLAELRSEQPQIFAMLKTEIKIVWLGFVQGQIDNGGSVYQHLPSQPPQIHQAVYACTPQEVIAFTKELHFLRTLVQMTHAPTDELIAAIFRDGYQLRQCDRPWLVRAGRKLGILLKEDYDRLGAILSQVHP
ncbi:MAG: hypothetical protein WCO45_16620 [Pseudanabaena sp. ELA607]|jgi:hypothetical protein